jgi:hypothetical protein
MPLSTWVIGSYKSLPATTITIVANGVSQGRTIDAGSYYIDDPNGDLSLCKQLELALEAHDEIGAVTVAICRDRKVRISSNVAFTASFDNAAAREALGFTGNLSSSSMSHVAQQVSPYLWSPRRPETPDALLGTVGNRVYDTRTGSSGGGRVVATTNNWVDENEFEWTHVPIARMRSSSAGSPGEWTHFFHAFLRRFWNFKVYRELEDDDASSTALVLADPLGPYVMKAPRQGLKATTPLQIPRVERYGKVALPVHTTPEYS